MKAFTKIAAVGVAAAAGLGITRQRAKLVGVAEELRHPALYIPMTISSDRSLRIARHLEGRFTPAVPSNARAESIPATADRPAIPAFVYERSDRTRPGGALLWIHGGGLIMGTTAMGHDICGRIADELNVLVVSVDYRLAPEYPFPAGLDDCFAALQWMHDQAGVLGIDPTRVAVGGDSAGGGLAACVAQMALDRDTPVCFQLLQYPMLDDRTALRTDDKSKNALGWSNSSNNFGWAAYLGHPVAQHSAHDDRDYAAASRRADLSGLAPAWIGVGTIDLFHDEDVAYADRLQAAGIGCELHIVPGMYHGADHIARKASSMKAFKDAMLAALGAAIAVPR